MQASIGAAEKFSRGLDDRGVLNFLEGERGARLKVNDKDQIQIAPAHWANEIKTKTLIHMHGSGLKEILRSRQEFAVVDVSGSYE